MLAIAERNEVYFVTNVIYRPLIVALCTTLVMASAHAVGRDGERVWQAECNNCHDTGNERIPSTTTLKALATGRIVKALESGSMRLVGLFNLSGPERVAVAEFLTEKPYDPGWATAQNIECRAAPWPRGDLFSQPHWNGWGNGLHNTRFQRAEFAKLGAADVPRLKLRWAFAFPGESFVESQPTVVGGRIFIGSPAGIVYALDAQTGCVHWTFQAQAPVKAPVTIGRLGAQEYAAYFGDQSGRVYALNAADGVLLWQDQGDTHPSARVTGGVQFYNGNLYVPMASLEEGLAMDPTYKCCVFRGSVIAYDARSGSRLWKQHTIDQEPTAIGRDTSGKPMLGPSGAAVWSAVTIDPKRQTLYIGTGDNYSDPSSTTSDAVIALDLATGKPQWIYQGRANDAWNVGCMSEPKINCPVNEGPDEDMGASPILATTPSGVQLLIGAQKSGVAHALDPDKNGALIWQKKLAKGGIQGGLQWGQATDGENLYASKSDTAWLSKSSMAVDVALDPTAGGGLTAVDLTSGEKKWEAPPIDCGHRPRCSPSQSAAITAIPGVIFSGSMAGIMRAFDTNTGATIWSYDAVREFDTINGATGRGGAFDQAGAVVVDGILYFNSGYAKWGGEPGNVLLAFDAAR